MNAEIMAKKQIELPKSIGQLINVVLKGFGKDTKKKLIKSLIISAVVFALNMLLSTVFGNSNSRFISSILVKPGNMLKGTLFWSILGANFVNLPIKIKGIGLLKLMGRLKSVLSRVLMFWKNPSKKTYSLGVIISLVVSIIFGNPALSAVTAFTLFMSSASRAKSKLYYIIRLFKAKEKNGEKKLPASESIVSIISGLTLGLTLYSFIGRRESSLFLHGFFIAFFIAIMLFSKRKKA